MSSTLFNNAQRIIKQMFDWLETSSQNKTANFITDSFQTGIIPLELGEFSVVPGSNNTPTTPTVTIGSGVAYGPDSSRITVPSGDTTPYNASAPLDTTNDGLGNLLPTPQSTGVVNIPLTQSSQNYLWIQYLATIDISAYTLNKETNAKQFYKQTDGYQIVVTTTNVAPGPNYLFLANVNMLGGGAVTSSVIFITGRTYFQISENVVPITTAFNNRSNATLVYAENSVLKLEDHIKAIGTGTGQSPTNPHNMSLADLGVGPLDTVSEHRILEHSNAIIAGTPGDDYPSTSAMAPSIQTNNPGSDNLLIAALTASQVAIVDGSAFSSSDIFGVNPFATIMFPDVSGTYNVFWSSTTRVFGISTSSIASDITRLWLATVTYTFVGHGPFDHNTLSSLIERRRIGSTSEKYQRWATTARPPVPLQGEYGFNKDLNIPEYYDGTDPFDPAHWIAIGVPTGVMLDFAGTTAPSGYLLCDGSSVSSSTFPALFAAIGYTWGGAGPNFNLPDMRRKVSVGSGGAGTGTLGNTVGNTGGAENITPTQNPHTHTENSHIHRMDTDNSAANINPAGDIGIYATGIGSYGTDRMAASNTSGGTPYTRLLAQTQSQSDTGMSSTTATNQPSSVIQPSAIVTKIIKF